MKKLFAFLLIFISLTACAPQKGQVQTETVITSDNAVTNEFSTDASKLPITAESENGQAETENILIDLPIYFNNSLITEQDVQQHKVLSRVHKGNIIDKKLKLALELVTSDESQLNIAYSVYTADFDNDGENEDVISQKWYSDICGNNLTSVWYCDLLCREVYSGDSDNNDIFTLDSSGREFLCIAPDLKDEEAYYVEIFTVQNGDMVKCVCKDGDLNWNGTELLVYYDNSYMTASWNETIGRFILNRPTPVTTFDETDEILVRGQKFAEEFAEMYWNYLCGAAWEDYVNIRYIDFEDKSEDNYFEYDGRPFYKLLISEYTYDEAVEYIKSFYTEELFNETVRDSLIFIGVDNCIYVNGTEPNFIYGLRNKHACILDYVENDDGTVTYNCYAESTEETEEDMYFSFTLNAEGKLCEDVFSSLLGLFSDKYY